MPKTVGNEAPGDDDEHTEDPNREIESAVKETGDRRSLATVTTNSFKSLSHNPFPLVTLSRLLDKGRHKQRVR